MDYVKDIFATALAVIAALGGGALIVTAFSSWLGKAWAGRILEKDRAKYAAELEGLKSSYVLDTERFRTSLKKSEFIFQKEFEAATELVTIVRSIRPIMNHPDMDWYEACDRIALDFDKLEKVLEGFITKHGAIMPDTVRDRIGSCIAWASEGKFHIGDPNDIDPQMNKLAGELFDELQVAEQEMIALIRGQAVISHPAIRSV